MGSGTTGVTAIQKGRNFVGIDIARNCVEIARKRLLREQQIHQASESTEKILKFNSERKTTALEHEKEVIQNRT
jgi:DNA modification methylase